MLTETDLAAGDFVRWVKQLLDLPDQVADAAGDGPLRKTAREASAALRRGVVAYSSVARLSPVESARTHGLTPSSRRERASRP